MFSGIYFILKNNFLWKIAGLFLITIFIQSCAEPEDNDTVEESAYENTLTNQTIGDGSTGAATATVTYLQNNNLS